MGAVEEIVLRLSGIGAYLGGIVSLALDSLSTGAVAFLALLVNWFYLRRRDKREQARFEQEMQQ